MNLQLAFRNKHPRDDNITLDEKHHIYQIKDQDAAKYISVSNWYHTLFGEFDADRAIKAIYGSKKWNATHPLWGKNMDEIKAIWKSGGDSSRDKGITTHKHIENYYNGTPVEDSSKEWIYFLNFVREHPEFTPYRTEWQIYHEELKLAGTVDMVFRNRDGTFSICDWKTCKKITEKSVRGQHAKHWSIMYISDSNYWHYCIQVNMYKLILESKYGIKVSKMFLIRLHSNAENYEMIEMKDIKEDLSEVLELRRLSVA